MTATLERPPEPVDAATTAPLPRTALVVGFAVTAGAAWDCAWPHAPGIGIAAFLWVVAIGLIASGLVDAKHRAAAGLSMVFAAALTVRSAPVLVLANTLAALGMLGLAVGGDDLLDMTLPRAIRRLTVGLGRTVPVVGFVERVIPARVGLGAPVARAAAVTTPVVLLLVALLASGDAVFASLFDFDLDIGAGAGHVVAWTLGAWAMVGLLRAAWMTQRDGTTSAASPVVLRLGELEATTLLAGMAGVYALFAGTQALSLLGASQRIVETQGLTYAEYARSGFFQLVAAAGITLAVLLSVRALTPVGSGSSRLRRMVLSQVTIGLTLISLAVAVQRLHMYEDAYGMTMLRLLALAAAAWIGAVLVSAAALVAGAGRDHGWFTPLTVAISLAMVLVLDVANPEAVVIERNVRHLASSGRFDALYAARLSDDALPAIAAHFDSLGGDQQLQLQQVTCARTPDRHPAAWTWSRQRADGARGSICGTYVDDVAGSHGVGDAIPVPDHQMPDVVDVGGRPPQLP
jgi:hypothetical protein